MRARDSGGTYSGPAAVSNNWLLRQVHIPPIMCITAPCTATPWTMDGYGISPTMHFPPPLFPVLCCTLFLP